jgi:hypothetical protein
MCGSRPKVQPMPTPPPPTTPVTVDEDRQRESSRERRRAASRYGRQSTLVTGGADAPSMTGKTLLGS